MTAFAGGPHPDPLPSDGRGNSMRLRRFFKSSSGDFRRSFVLRHCRLGLLGQMKLSCRGTSMRNLLTMIVISTVAGAVAARAGNLDTIGVTLLRVTTTNL